MKKMKQQTKFRVRETTQIGMLAAVAVILMLFEVALPFAPTFYKIDLSEVPVLVGCFAMGPLAGVLIELVKVLLNLLINGTTTMCVGEFGNFLIGCAMCLPAAWIYKSRKSKKNAILGLLAGTCCMTVAGCVINAYVLLPAYAKALHLPIADLVAMGSAIHAGITDLLTFVCFVVAPFNLLKGTVVSVIVVLIYKKISPVLKMNL